MEDMNEQEANEDSSTYPFLAHAHPRPGQLEMIQDGIKALERGDFILLRHQRASEKRLLRWLRPSK